MNDLRRSGIVGIIEVDGLQPTSLHFAEWWNGEGFDVTINNRVVSYTWGQWECLQVLVNFKS